MSFKPKHTKNTCTIILKRRCIAFAHGLNVHFGLIEPKKVLMLMMAPKGPGHTVRGEYTKGGGVPCLVAVDKDESGKLDWLILLLGNWRGRSELSNKFPRECETDLFGEQAVLWGLIELIRCGSKLLLRLGMP